MDEFIFILKDRRVSRTPLIDEAGICIDETGLTHQPGEFTKITSDERLILTPAKDLSDDELREALQALQRTRLESSDRPKGRTRKQNYEAETGLRLSREQIEANKGLGLDDLLAELGIEADETEKEVEEYDSDTEPSDPHETTADLSSEKST